MKSWIQAGLWKSSVNFNAFSRPESFGAFLERRVSSIKNSGNS
jgi:hypothetical protein